MVYKEALMCDSLFIVIPDDLPARFAQRLLNVILKRMLIPALDFAMWKVYCAYHYKVT